MLAEGGGRGGRGGEGVVRRIDGIIVMREMR